MGSEFKRVLGRLDVFTLSFGAMIGWGWVVLTGDWILQAGVMGSMLALVLGGFVVALVGLIYAELTSAMPKVGGEHVFSYHGLGLEASFLCTWFIILGYVSICAIEAVALPVVIGKLFPLNSGEPLWVIDGNPVHVTWIAVGVLGSLVMGAVNHFGVKTAAFLQTFFTAMIAIAGLMLIFGSFFSPYADVSSAELFDTNKMSFDLFATGESSKGLLAVLVAIPFLFVGFDVIPQAAEEINLPFKQIGRVLIFSVLLAIAWYIALVFSVGKTLSAAELQGDLLATASAMEKIYNGSWAKNFLIFAGLAGILTSWNSFFVGATRAIYAMGHSDMLPRQFAILHPRHKTPTYAILLVTTTSILASFFGKGAILWLVHAGGFGIVISWSFVCLAFYRLRQIKPDMPRPFKVAKGKWIGASAFILSLALAYLYFPGKPSALTRVEWTIVFCWMGFGGVMYLLANKFYGRAEMKNKMDQHMDS